MKSLAVWMLGLWLATGNLLSAADGVTLVRGERSVKVLINGEVFTVFRFGDDRRKPFFLPATGPGGFPLLEQAVANEPAGGTGRKVFVCSETATMATTGIAPETAHYGDVLEITKVDGERLWVGARNCWINRSDVAPLASIVTRLVNDDPPKVKDKLSADYYDHPHHKGIWFSVDEVNGIKFWMEDSLIVSQKVETSGGGASAKLHVVNHWLDKENKPVLIETTTITITPGRLLSYDATLTAAAEVQIGDTKEGMFAVRIPNSMREFAGGGPVTNADGAAGTKDAWGRPSHWVNYNGPVDGHVFGVTVMDSPKNPWASRYHVRDYGLFALNPFGAGAYTADTDKLPAHERTLKPGDALRFRFGLWVHGEASREQIDKAYGEFAATDPRP